MTAIQIHYHDTPAGELIMGSIGDRLCLCNWRHKKTHEQVNSRLKRYFNTELVEGNSPVIEQTIQQLSEYFSGERTAFSVPLAFAGTAFQKRVWEQLLLIPFGETWSYLDLANRLGDANATRAVGTANGANAISILVPCHRVIGKNGSLTGYAGGLGTKEKLLQIEGCLPQPEQNDLFA
ncbi:methylated-DNA--[protein]-cysteine S-methyltransferase [Kiloniella sp. b19]|uniref:methylated-DNA--[protein]-cysteine S-methyltransferase n=1 Tax=Kiloniella sp. GXU_MW_B19 TaxID=3141326 RepID=UPI0031D311E1